MVKDLNYWKNNCEEDYIHTPISVLRYISELEKSFGLEEPEKVVDIYIKVYKEGLGVNYFKQQELGEKNGDGNTQDNN